MSTSSRRPAVVYCRISEDKAGDAAGVARQEADARDLADRLGWEVVDVITENDTSAYRKRRVRLPDGRLGLRVIRPGYRRMLDLLADGTARGLVVYDLDRLARDPRDLEDLVEARELHGIEVRSVTGSVDLSTDGGVAMARVLLAMAAKSSADTARRVARKHLELAQAGRPGGGGRRGYGYARDGMTVLPDEAAAVRRMAAELIAGSSLSSVAAGLNRDGVPTVTGTPWSSRSVSAVVSKPRVAGLRVHRGEVAGPAAWPAILEPETWRAVLAALNRRRGGTNRLRRWLTGVLLCERCGEPLIGWTGNNGPRYWCAPAKSRATSAGCGRTAVAAGPVEGYVERLLLAYLARPDVAAGLAAQVTTDRAAGLAAEVAAGEAQLLELAEAYGARALTMAEYLAARRVIDDRLTEARRLLAAAAPTEVRRLIGPDVAARWADLDARARRDVARIVFPDGLPVGPSQARVGVFDPARVILPASWRAA